MLEKLVTKKSNCLFEALKAKIKDPKHIKIGYLPPAINDGRFHFWWLNESEGKAYHFRQDDDQKKETPFFFSGSICRNDFDVFRLFVIKKCFYAGKGVEATQKYGRRAGLSIPIREIEDGFYQRVDFDSDYAKWYRAKYYVEDESPVEA